MQQPIIAIVPLGPDTERVALYLDDELVGHAETLAQARATLAELVDEILTMAYGRDEGSPQR
ncbi:MAG: hypothetical protein WCG26_01415 [Chloroflexales bacterium]